MSLAFADADWVGDMDACCSTTGYLFKVFGDAVAWKSHRRPTVANFTTEAKYMAAANASRQAIWIPLFLDNLGLRLEDKCHDQQAIEPPPSRKGVSARPQTQFKT